MVSVNKYLELVQHLQASGDLGPGRTFWVNGGTAQHKANGGSDNNQNDGLSPERPFATIDYATGLLVPFHQVSLTCSSICKMVRREPFGKGFLALETITCHHFL